MNVTSIQNNFLLSNSGTIIKKDEKVDFHAVLETATGKNLASEIEKSYKVTLETGCGYNISDIINNNYSSKNIVCISQETLLKMERNPALKNKILDAIEQFSSPEEQAKVNALQPPVKSAGMIVYPDGDVLYWLEGYSNGDDNDKKKQKLVTESSSNILIDQYLQESICDMENHYDQVRSFVAASFSKTGYEKIT